MKRFLFFFILFLVVLWRVADHPRFLLLLETVRHKSIDAERLTNSYNNLGYVLADNHWISFPLTPNIEKIKVVTNANITKEESKHNAVEYHYTLEYEIRGGRDNAVLQHGNYYHRSQLTRYKDPESEQEYTASLYLDPKIIPVDGRVMILNPADRSPLQQAKQIRLRLVGQAQEVMDVLLRIYTTEQNVRPEELNNWQRLSIPRRQKQARGNVYPYDFLYDEEKINLMNSRWRPVGPLGVPGKDYHVRSLYTLKERNEETVIDNKPPPLPAIGPQKAMTLPIAAGGMNLRFSLKPMEHDEETGEKTVHFNWFGLTPAERSRREIPVKVSEETVIEFSFGQGLVEIRSEHPFNVQILQRQNRDWVEWRPEPLFSRTMLCDSQEGVGFTLTHLDNRPTPLRITLRAPVTGEIQDEYRIEYELLGSSGGKGFLNFSPQPSPYDQMLLGGLETPISEPVIYYWNLPQQVTGIRLTSSAPVLVAAATRPPTLSHLVRVPEDYDRTSITDGERQPVWFPLLADKYRDLFRRQRSVLLHVQQSPPDDNPDLLAGLYLYGSLRPSLQWAGRFLLLPPDRSPRLRQPDPAVIFYPLTKGTAKVKFIDENEVNITLPRLLFFKENKQSTGMITLLMDEKPYFSAELHGRSGQIHLPAVPIGSHRLTVKTTVSDNTELFMNHLQRDEEGYPLRFASRLTRQGLQFDYLKKTRESESLSFTFFSPAVTERAKIRVRLLGNTPLADEVPGQDFTLLDRRFDIEIRRTESVKILNLGGSLVGAGRKLFFPIGNDIMPGDYTFSVELEDGAEGYLLLSQITPGTFSSRKLIREQH